MRLLQANQKESIIFCLFRLYDYQNNYSSNCSHKKSQNVPDNVMFIPKLFFNSISAVGCKTCRYEEHIIIECVNKI